MTERLHSSGISLEDSLPSRVHEALAGQGWTAILIILIVVMIIILYGEDLDSRDISV